MEHPVWSCEGKISYQYLSSDPDIEGILKSIVGDSLRYLYVGITFNPGNRWTGVDVDLPPNISSLLNKKENDDEDLVSSLKDLIKETKQLSEDFKASFEDFVSEDNDDLFENHRPNFLEMFVVGIADDKLTIRAYERDWVKKATELFGEKRVLNDNIGGNGKLGEGDWYFVYICVSDKYTEVH